MYWRQTLHVWVLLIMSWIHSSFSMCPVGCICHNDILSATCYKGGLEYLPIQLNPELRHMNLSLNKITKVHFLNVYSKLEHFDVSQNRIRTIEPYTFEYQTHLIFLNMSHNNISRLHKESFLGLTSVTEFDLSYNNLEMLESVWFRHFTSLKLFKSTNNQLIGLEKGLFAFSKNLVELVLDENRLHEVPGQAIGDAPNLKILKLKNNAIEIIKAGDIPLLPSLRILSLKLNFIRDIDENAFSKISGLDYLDISDNNLTQLPTVSLEKLQQLTKLNIGGNYIKSIPPIAFRGLFHMKRLRVDRSLLLSRIDHRAFVDNLNLESVWLDNNIAIEALPTRLFHGNPRLSQIYIRNNHLTTLEAMHFPLDQLKVLLLGGNPFECNCSILWLWRLGQEQENTIGNDTNQTELVIDMDEILCETPEHLFQQLLGILSEYQLGCSWGLLITVYSIFIVGMLVFLIGILVFVRSGKLLQKKTETVKEASTVPSPDDDAFSYKDEACTASPYIAQSEIPDDYKEIEQWDTFDRDNTFKYYKPANRNIKQKPHIVYV